jgi:hypothetical protein
MINLKIDTKSLQKTLNKIADKKRVSKIVSKALSKVALAIRQDSIPLTPRGTGELVNSWRVVKENDLTVEIGYDIVYAMYQHQGRREDGTYIIRNRPAGGQSFFLKEPIDQNAKKYFDLFEELVFKEIFNV